MNEWTAGQMDVQSGGPEGERLGEEMVGAGAISTFNPSTAGWPSSRLLVSGDSLT